MRECSWLVWRPSVCVKSGECEWWGLSVLGDPSCHEARKKASDCGEHPVKSLEASPGAQVAARCLTRGCREGELGWEHARWLRSGSIGARKATILRERSSHLHATEQETSRRAWPASRRLLSQHGKACCVWKPCACVSNNEIFPTFKGVESVGNLILLYWPRSRLITLRELVVGS